jgi:membrane protease YdiL (CAAX protease family)
VSEERRALLVGEVILLKEESTNFEGGISRRVVVGLALVLEGLLVVVFFVWSWLRGYSITSLPSVSDILLGLLYAALLFSLNFSLLFLERSLRLRGSQALVSIRVLFDHYCKPLADSLRIPDMIVVSLAAGVGEELFFRVVLQEEFGFIIANVLFAVLHFGFASWRFAVPLLVYFLIGCLFSLQLYLHQSVCLLVITHALYDFIALCWLKWRYCKV